MIRMLRADWFSVKDIGFSSEVTEGADQNLLRPESVLEHLCVPATINTLNAELNPICYLPALLGVHHFLHVSRIRVNNCSSSLWFYRWSVVVAVLLVVVGPAGRPDYDQQHCYHHAPTVKPEAATAVVELLMMDVRTPETC